MVTTTEGSPRRPAVPTGASRGREWAPMSRAREIAEWGGPGWSDEEGRRGSLAVRSWGVGVAERPREEEGCEAGNPATQLAVAQSVVALVRRPHPLPSDVAGHLHGAPCVPIGG